MKNLALKVQRFLKSEDGPTAVEYAVMLALIVIVCLTAIQAIGTKHRYSASTVDQMPRQVAAAYVFGGAVTAQ